MLPSPANVLWVNDGWRRFDDSDNGEGHRRWLLMLESTALHTWTRHNVYNSTFAASNTTITNQTGEVRSDRSYQQVESVSRSLYVVEGVIPHPQVEVQSFYALTDTLRLLQSSCAFVYSKRRIA